MRSHRLWPKARSSRWAVSAFGWQGRRESDDRSLSLREESGHRHSGQRSKIGSIQVVLAGDADQREQGIAAGVGEGRMELQFLPAMVKTRWQTLDRSSRISNSCMKPFARDSAQRASAYDGDTEHRPMAMFGRRLTGAGSSHDRRSRASTAWARRSKGSLNPCESC
jgi:hypothetical protein